MADKGVMTYSVNEFEGMEKQIATLTTEIEKYKDSRVRLRKWNENCHDRYEELEQELELVKGELSYFTDPHSAYDSSKGCPACEWKEGVITKLCWTHEVYQKAEKREALLREALEESHEVVIYLQNNTEHLKDCPDMPMTCMRCVVGAPITVELCI